MSKRLRSMLDEELIPVTLDRLQLANRVAHAAANGGMPRKSFKASYEDGVEKGEIEPGKYFVLTDDPVNHAAMAIMETFNPTRSEQGRELAQSLLHRTIFAGHDVYSDERAKRYLKQENDEDFIGHPRLEAFATTPLRANKPTPLDAIFTRAEEIAAADGWDEETSP